MECSDRARTFAFARRHLLSILAKFGHPGPSWVTFSPNLMLFLELCEEIITNSRIPLKIALKPTKSEVGWSDPVKTLVYASKCVPKHPGKVWAPSEHYGPSWSIF